MRILKVGRWALLVAAGVSALAADERIEVGVLRLDVHVSRTATLFHVVDQLSEWSYFCHRQYGRAFAPLSDADRAMLEQHKLIRARHGWGAGLEQTLYSPLKLDEALKQGIAHGWLSAGEAATEREVLLHFADRIDALLTAQSPTLSAFRDRLRRELTAQAELLTEFARFTGAAPDPVPVFLMPNPDTHNLGGGYNGGRLTLEVPSAVDAVPTALHELFHAFLETKKVELESAVAGVPGLDLETLNEGLAYAVAPGLFHNGPAPGDPLAEEVRRDLASGSSLSDNFTRYHRYALALRPLLRGALADEHQTLRTFLPRAVDVWRALAEVEKAREGTVSAELRTVTMVRLYRRDEPELPDFVKAGKNAPPNRTEYFVACKEWVEGTYRQMSDFYRRASHAIIFTAPGHPDVQGYLNGHTVSSGDGAFQAYGVQIVAEERAKIVPGVAYGVKPVNTSESYRWQVSDDFRPVVLRE